jgi:hypothetical protein
LYDGNQMSPPLSPVAGFFMATSSVARYDLPAKRERKLIMKY